MTIDPSSFHHEARTAVNNILPNNSYDNDDDDSYGYAGNNDVGNSSSDDDENNSTALMKTTEINEYQPPGPVTFQSITDLQGYVRSFLGKICESKGNPKEVRGRKLEEYGVENEDLEKMYTFMPVFNNCNYCLKTFSSPADLYVHKPCFQNEIRGGKKGGKSACSWCQTEYAPSWMKAHVATHFDPQFTCNLCGVKLHNLPELTRHAVSYHPESYTVPMAKQKAYDAYVCNWPGCKVKTKPTNTMKVYTHILDYHMNLNRKNVWWERDFPVQKFPLTCNFDTPQVRKKFIQDCAQQDRHPRPGIKRVNTPAESSPMTATEPQGNEEKVGPIQTSCGEFASMAELKVHVRKNLIKLCAQSIKLKEHFNSLKDPKEVLTCKKCDATFNTPEALVVHAPCYCAADAKEVRCQACGAGFASIFTLRYHMLTHLDPSFECKTCGAKINSRSDAVKHFLQEHKQTRFVRSYRCGFDPESECSLESSYIGKIEKHILTDHLNIPTESFECKYCGSVLSAKQSLDTHILRYHENPAEAIDCIAPNCKKQFGYLASMRKHAAIQHPQAYRTWIESKKVFRSGRFTGKITIQDDSQVVIQGQDPELYQKNLEMPVLFKKKGKETQRFKIKVPEKLAKKKSTADQAKDVSTEEMIRRQKEKLQKMKQEMQELRERQKAIKAKNDLEKVRKDYDARIRNDVKLQKMEPVVALEINILAVLCNDCGEKHHIFLDDTEHQAVCPCQKFKERKPNVAELNEAFGIMIPQFAPTLV